MSAPEKRVSLVGSVVGLVIFTVIGWAAVWGYLRLFQPETFVPLPPPVTDFDRTAMLAAVEPGSVGEELATIRGFGSRFLGQEGFYDTAAHIEARYKAAGLEMYAHDIETVAPAVLESRMVDTAGAPVGVDIHPFMPNHLQPISTPPEGVRGELVLVTEELLNSAASFTGKIAVIDGSQTRIKSYEWDWTKYAREGFEAVILTHTYGLDELTWSGATQMVATTPVNYVRLAAENDILDHLGEEVVLHVRCEFQNTPNRTIVGVLKAGQPTGQALVVPVAYDAGSMLPGHAPGGLQALPVALQLKLLDGLLPYRDQLRRDVIFVAIGSRVMANDGANQLAACIGRYRREAERRNKLEEQHAHAETQLKRLETTISAFDDPDFCADGNKTGAVMDGWDENTQSEFLHDTQYLLNTIVQQRSEVMLQAKIEFEASGGEDTGSSQFTDYMKAKNRYNIVFLLAGYRPAKIFRDRKDEAEELDLRAKLLAHQLALRDHFTTRQHRLEQSLALSTLFTSYRDLVFVSPNLVNREPLKPIDVVVRQPAMDQPEPMPPAGAARLEHRLSDDGQALEVYAMGLGDELDGYWSIDLGPTAVMLQSVISHLQTPQGPFTVDLKPASKAPPEKITFFMGSEDKFHTGTQPGAMKNLVDASIQNLQLGGKVALSWHGVKQGGAVHGEVSAAPVQTRIWSQLSFPAFSLFSPGPGYSLMFNPYDPEWTADLSNLEQTLKVTGDVFLMLAYGNGHFEDMQFQENVFDLNGAVYASGVGQSILPNFPLAGAVVANKMTSVPANHGYYPYLMMMTDIYGRYEYGAVATTYHEWGGHEPEAAWYDENGQIIYMKDEGTGAQAVYKSLNVGSDHSAAINIVCFRATPVSIFDLTNPQTLNAYSSVQFIRAQGLAPFESRNDFSEGDRVCTAFIPPDEHFYVLLRAGSLENELVQKTRAFMLGTDMADVIDVDPAAEADVRAGSEIRGAGYLAAHTPLLLNVPLEVAKSMADVNNTRLRVQNRSDFNMADERTVEFQDKNLELLREIADSQDSPQKERVLKARDAVTYATLNHPILRENIFEAVAGIIWYLGLMVPFVFFFEKLAFGHSDIRKQLFTVMVIFLTVFIALKLMHPAFTMIRSSFMILLGFVIILISGGISVLFSGKFKENLEQIRKKEGKVSAADVNKMGVISTAFLLGLNNMHRRRVRTGLTCATLTLLTFVMICFTSIQSDLVDRQVAVGKASYSGFTIKEEMFRTVPDATYNALNRKYGDRFGVVKRQFYIGTEDRQTQERTNPDFRVAYVSEDGTERNAIAASTLILDPREPLAANLALSTTKPWFRPDPLPGEETRVMLPANIAAELQISAELVDRQDVKVTVGGAEYTVQGIFDPQSLEDLVDLDGMNLLPLDVTALQLIQGDSNTIIAPETEPRIPATSMLIMPPGSHPKSENKASARTYSVALIMPEDLPYKDARFTIDSYLEQSGRSTYYGLDGYSFSGKRARERSMAGLIDMLIPLIIAALTVLNTMKGSVYERRDEIFVYNAVPLDDEADRKQLEALERVELKRLWPGYPGDF